MSHADELWIGLDPRLVMELPDQLRDNWPADLMPVAVTGVDDAPEVPEQRMFIGGLAGLFATAGISVHAIIDGEVQMVICSCVHPQTAAVCLRIREPELLCARVVPASSLSSVITSLIPQRGVHAISCAVRPAGVSSWRDAPIAGIVPPMEPGEFAQLLRTELARAEYARTLAGEST